MWHKAEIKEYPLITFLFYIFIYLLIKKIKITNFNIYFNKFIYLRTEKYALFFYFPIIVFVRVLLFWYVRNLFSFFFFLSGYNFYAQYWSLFLLKVKKIIFFHLFIYFLLLWETNICQKNLQIRLKKKGWSLFKNKNNYQ